MLISMWEKAGRAEQDARGSRGDPAASAQQIPGLGHHGGQEWGEQGTCDSQHRSCVARSTRGHTNTKGWSLYRGLSFPLMAF